MGTNTLKTLLVEPKDKDSKLQKSGVIYNFKCPHINCPDEYIGESGRAFGDRIKEHLMLHHPSISIVVQQATHSVQTALPS